MLKKIISIAILTGSAFTTAVAPAKAASLGCSYASHYGIGDGYHGSRTASGEVLNAYGLTAAHRSLPFGTKLRITDQSTGRSAIIRINDRGPFAPDRILDLTYGAFASIAAPSRGVTKICIAKI
ncbi:MAG: septal ring lytic transglycosylase RlpA family protein [Candidatus Nanopelagicaceae bacterium]